MSNRSMLSPIKMISLDNFNQDADLLAAHVGSIKPGDDFWL